MSQRDYALGARIKAAMKAAGFKTAKQFSETYNIPYLTFAQHIQGRRQPNAKLLETYSTAFGVTVDWLKTGEGHPLLRKQKRSSNTQQQKTIEHILKDEMNKLPSSSRIHTELLAKLLEKVLPLKKKYQLNDRKCAQLIANLYAQISETTQEKILQKKMISVFVKTYEATLKN